MLKSISKSISRRKEQKQKDLEEVKDFQDQLSGQKDDRCIRIYVNGLVEIDDIPTDICIMLLQRELAYQKALQEEHMRRRIQEKKGAP